MEELAGPKSGFGQQQALNQQRMDMAYQDFLRQMNYPMEQLQQYSSLLRGVPVTPNTTSTIVFDLLAVFVLLLITKYLAQKTDTYRCICSNP